VQKSTQALYPVKGADNTFDFNPKWTTTLPSLIYLYRIFIETALHKANSNINVVDIRHPGTSST
jgi:hypothetical protein